MMSIRVRKYVDAKMAVNCNDSITARRPEDFPRRKCSTKDNSTTSPKSVAATMKITSAQLHSVNTQYVTIRIFNAVIYKGPLRQRSL